MQVLFPPCPRMVPARISDTPFDSTSSPVFTAKEAQQVRPAVRCLNFVQQCDARVAIFRSRAVPSPLSLPEASRIEVRFSLSYSAAFRDPEGQPDFSDYSRIRADSSRTGPGIPSASRSPGLDASPPPADDSALFPDSRGRQIIHRAKAPPASGRSGSHSQRT
jgi:hypothetical protein